MKAHYFFLWSAFLLPVFPVCHPVSAGPDTEAIEKEEEQREQVSTRWSFKTDHIVIAPPTVSNGRVFAGTNAGSMYALDAESGEKLWKFEGGHRVLSSPLAVDGRVYFGALDGNVYCLNAETGETVWSFNANGPVQATPSISGNRLFIGCNNLKEHNKGYVYALNRKTGEKMWKYPTEGSVTHTLTVHLDRVFGRDTERNFFALDAGTGREIWSLDDENDWDIYRSTNGYEEGVSVAAGRLFVPAQGKIHVIDSGTGTKIRSIQPEDEEEVRSVGRIRWSTPVISAGRVFTSDRPLFCFHALTGKELWSVEAQGVPIVAGDRVYQAHSPKIRAFDMRSGAPLWTHNIQTEQEFTVPVIQEDRLYVGCYDQNVYALSLPRDASDTDWPTHNQNPQRNGVVHHPVPEPLKEELVNLKNWFRRDQDERLNSLVNSWAESTHPLRKIGRQVISLYLENEKSPEKLIRAWQETYKKEVIGLLLTDRRAAGDLIRAIHENERVINFLDEQAKNLDQKDYRAREQATKMLRKAGVLALPVLRKRRKSSNPEVRSRVRSLIKEIKDHWSVLLDE